MSCKGLFLILEISFHLSLPLVKIEKLTALGSEAIQLVQKHPNVSVASIVREYQKPSEKQQVQRQTCIQEGKASGIFCTKDREVILTGVGQGSSQIPPRVVPNRVKQKGSFMF